MQEKHRQTLIEQIRWKKCEEERKNLTTSTGMGKAFCTQAGRVMVVSIELANAGTTRHKTFVANGGSAKAERLEG